MLTFAPGETAQSVTVDVNGDLLHEPNELLTLQLSSPMNAVISRGSGAGTIIDDDPAPSVSIGDASAAEGQSGTTPLTFQVTLSSSGELVTVDYQTVDGSAEAGSDYAAVSGTLSFGPGETTKAITVLVNGDQTFESDESFTVALGRPTGAIVTGPAGLGSILNDDPVSGFFGVSPCRLIDTREADGPLAGPVLRAGEIRTFTLVGTCGIPTTAKAVSINITVTSPTGPGYLTLFPAGTPLPTVSMINYAVGETRANNAVVVLGSAGSLSVLAGLSAGSVHLILDVNGYFR